MPNVLKLKLVPSSNQRTVEALECLLRNALRGEIKGIALCYRTKEGVDEVLFTDAYAAHPDKAIGAAMRLSWRMSQAHEESFGPP